MQYMHKASYIEGYPYSKSGKLTIKEINIILFNGLECMVLIALIDIKSMKLIDQYSALSSKRNVMRNIVIS